MNILNLGYSSKLVTCKILDLDSIMKLNFQQI
jgi:hypothetical protein